VPINWFEEDVFQEEPFSKFDIESKDQLEKKLFDWNQRQFSTWNKGTIPFNSLDYDAVTREMYEWLHNVNPDVQSIVWNARHYIMLARVKNAIRRHLGQRILCINGADHNYWYHQVLQKEKEIDVVYPLR
jgi:hypothetical protein